MKTKFNKDLQISWKIFNKINLLLTYSKYKICRLKLLKNTKLWIVDFLTVKIFLTITHKNLFK